MSSSAMKLTLKEGPRHEALPALTVMTRRIEAARKHGPFDPRWLTARPVKELEELEQALPAAMAGIAPSRVNARHKVGRST